MPGQLTAISARVEHCQWAPEKVGIVLLAAVWDTATLINGSIVRPELLDGVVDTGGEQFICGVSTA